ncbi:MAG: acetyl-CoA carboxylase carboxyl transferase subunit beta, partial [Gammaproteobacteria bacterium]|nr:acetyl-CoA carboxylase carboxyl transferase subunit beta [Gammaproteobacteria bacterium]
EHLRIGAEQYIRLLLDEDAYEEFDADLRSGDPLTFTDLKPYPQRLEAAERKTGQGEALRSVGGTL